MKTFFVFFVSFFFTYELLSQDASAIFAEIANNAPSALAKSRKVLLGSRDPAHGSCITPVQVGEVNEISQKLARKSIPNGGCGTKYVDFVMSRDVKSPMADFTWHQEKLKPFLEGILKENSEAAKEIQSLEIASLKLLSIVENWTSVPELASIKTVEQSSSWPEYCLAKLATALEKRDLAGVKCWSRETAGAFFGLADLHRWLQFLAVNQIMAISFQSGCEGLFRAMDEKYTGKYKPETHIARFPAGNLTLYGGDNYLEVERQAESFFFVSPLFCDAIQTDEKVSVPYFLTPDIRPLFLELKTNLSGNSVALWEKAAQTPFERSFLANIIWRARAGGFEKQLAVVLQRFNAKFAKNKNLTVSDLMDILPYRGAYFSALEWADRFDSRLMKMSADKSLSGTNNNVLAAAQKIANKYYGGKENYTGLVLTLRTALDGHKMDCIRMTDFIAALYRNSGQPGFRKARILRGGSGHTVAAAEEMKNGKLSAWLADGLVKGDTGKPWPQSCFSSDGYAVEFYGRGIDSWVFLEGYIVAGTNAGILCRVECPWLPGHEKNEQKKVKKP